MVMSNVIRKRYGTEKARGRSEGEHPSQTKFPKGVRQRAA